MSCSCTCGCVQRLKELEKENRELLGLVAEITGAPYVLDDSRIRYVDVQVSRVWLKQAREFLSAKS